ncbi:MAG: GspE/PulE family protein [Kiritimatiellae bacterium]|nr:GspE/PulE family protein [Kiritimatiellia bacterium]
MKENKRYRPLTPSIAPSVGDLFANPEKYEGDAFLDEMFQAVVKDAVSASASDLHLDPGKGDSCLRMRVDGALHDVQVMPQNLATRIVNHFKVTAGLDPGPTLIPDEGWADYQLDERLIHLRVSCVPTVSGDKLSIRIFDESHIFGGIHDLGMTETQSDLIHEWLGNIQGLFLVVGAVGSGKSTTLYALLNQLRKRTRSVVTIEDPVEYRIEGVNQIQVSPSTDFDFPEALKSVMRLDPDDIMFGEIRDPVSAAAAIDASATGKVLLSTLHSRDAVGAVISLRNYGVKDHEIAALLETVVAQRLVRKLCDSCKKETSVSDSDKAWLKSIGRKAPKNLYEANPGGCEACGGVGYKGRTGIFEVWRLRQKDKELLIQHPAEQALRQQIRDWGLPSLFDASWDLLTTGTTSLEEIRPLSGLVAGED